MAIAAILFVLAGSGRLTLAIEENSLFVAVRGGSYTEGLLGQPIAINPLISQNPADLDISALIYSNLSDLLSVYEKSKDNRIHNLKIKEELKWDDGQLLTSDDVIFTIKTIQDPATRSPLFKNWQGIVVERISELQIQLTLPTPYVFIAENIKRLPILPKHIFGSIPAANLQLSSYNLEPVGNGPYRFKNFSKRRNGFITDYALTINENYAGEKPFIKDFYFKFYTEENDLFRALRLHQINGFGSLTPFAAESYGSSNLKTINVPMPRYYAIFINQNVNPLLKKSEFRKALTEAIDKEKINREIFKGGAKIITSPLFLSTSSQNDSGATTYNPGQAQELISALLKKNKLELTLITPKTDFLQKTAEIIKDNWQSVGVDKVNIVSLEQTDLLNNVIKARNYEFLLFGNVLENPFDLFPFWHSSGRFYPGLNLALYQNSKVDNFIESVRQTDDTIQEQTLLQNAVDLIIKDNPAIFLFSLPYAYIHTTNLEGFAFEDGLKYLITPADRFQNVSQWSVSRARVLKSD